MERRDTQVNFYAPAWMVDFLDEYGKKLGGMSRSAIVRMFIAQCINELREKEEGPSWEDCAEMAYAGNGSERVPDKRVALEKAGLLKGQPDTNLDPDVCPF